MSAALLEVRDLTRNFGGLRAVDGIALTVPPGHVRALIGPNGAGKSTVVNLLSGALTPTTGSIRLDGREMGGRRASHVARAGMVRTFQNGRLFERLTVLENVLVGADGRFASGLLGSILRSPGFRAEEKSREAEARGLLDQLGMADDAERVVGSLPYGRQRKVELARALIQHPRVLLLDEPAAGLNSGEVEALLEYVSGLRDRGLGIVLIEHNMGLVMRLADSITVMNFGRIIAEGSPQDVRNDEAVVEAYLGRRRAYARV
jgi:branched-chain amino acid transport system ATP-binding protein